MLIEAALQVREGLSELIRIVNDGGTPAVDARRVLVESKAFAAQVAVLQADAAAVVAASERHGDSGAGVLAQVAGLSKRDAASQVRTAEKLQEMPAVRDALQNGEIPLANAKVLAEASKKTSVEQVQQDSGLLEKAAELSPERFAREAGRWAASRQDDGGESEYRRQRARRRLSIWDGDDGMVHLRGELDPVAGAKIRTRLLKEAERLRREDVRSPGGEQRTYHQRLADALDALTADDGNHRGGGVNRPSAEIVLVQHLSAEGTAAFAEIAGGGTIPQSVLEEHFCNAALTGVAFSDKGKPLWQGYTKRTATRAQMRALEAQYGGCGGCGGPFVLCQAHHIEPASRGGPTDVDNMMPLCWGCHQKVHHHHWRVVPAGELFTIEPSQSIHYGPAHAPDPPPTQTPLHARASRRPAPSVSAQPPGGHGRTDQSPSDLERLEQSRPDRDKGSINTHGPRRQVSREAGSGLQRGDGNGGETRPRRQVSREAGSGQSSLYKSEPLFTVD